MSLQWTFVATFLYSEIFMCVLLMLPFISVTRWQKVFRSRLLNALRSYANLYFNIFICVLVVLFFDGIRDVRRYSTPINGSDLKINPHAEVVLHMKLFRAQRNFYIAGFALFLFVVLRRLVTLLSQQAVLVAEGEAARRQALSATAAGQRILDSVALDQNEAADNKENEKGERVESAELLKARKELEKLHEDLNRARIDVETMKKQTESTNNEYDRLLAEHTSLQNELIALNDSTPDKKTD